MLNITKRISKYNFSSGNNIKYIVVHDTGNTTDTAEANANYFNGGDRQASAHYFVDDDSIVQVVEDVNAAWHCGDGHGAYGITNHNSIGIEMCRVNNTVTSTTEKNTIELVKYLMNKYNVSIDNVVRHYDASRKTCPASFSANNWARWSAFKEKLVSRTSSETSNSLYRVQTGAFLVKANADALLAKIKAAGFETYMVQIDGLYKVQVGAYSIKENADAMMAKLKAKGFDAFITTNSESAVSSGGTTPTIKVGSRVKVKPGARTYTGGGIASFVYNNVYTVDELKGDRAVLDANGICTPFKVFDLILQ
ncbi:MAG: N-acetylmuramoyl-L-alanine amidase [Clostridium argentinense]|nr:N-acetylmuramoyl-L-alanine amidase [Clostridium argentinense]